MNKIYFTKFNKIKKETIIKYIKYKNIIFYLKLKIINYKLPLIIKKLNSLNKIKRILTLILNVILTGIYNRILDKRITEKGFIK